MTTEELVHKLLDYIKQGKNVQAEEELYAEDIISVEQDGRIEKGKAAIIEKTKAAIAGIETFHGGGVSQTFVGPDCFLLEFDMDVTPKGGERMQMKEFGFYKVKDGKVVEEYFFMKAL